MRVLHVIPSLDARDGGPSIALPLMARSLAAHGVKVDVVATMTAEDAAAQGIAFGEPVAREGFTVRFFRRQTSFYKVALPLRRWVRCHVREFDLLHIHAVFSFVPLAAAGVARRAGIPYIMRPLGLLNSWGMENRRRRVKAASFRFFDRPALDHAAAVHYTSDDERDEAARLNLKSRPVVLPLGIDLGPFQHLPPAAEFLDRFPEARGRELVLFLSRINPKKGLDELLPAFAQLRTTRPQAMLVIAGDGDAGYVRSLHAKADSLGICKDVLWTGMIEGGLKMAAFAAAKIFVLPSHSENFGIALLEAMAAGLPCLSTREVALAREAEVKAAARTARVDVQEFCQEMQRLMADDDGARSLAKAARAFVQERYSLEALGNGLLNMYQDILNRTPHG